MRFEPYDTDRQKVFSRRALLVGGGATGLFCAVGARLYQLQVVEYERYAGESRENQFSQRLIPPLRGEIRDRFGRLVATNRNNFRVLLVPEETNKSYRVMPAAKKRETLLQVLDAFGEIIEVSDEEIARILRQSQRNSTFTPIEIVDNLDWEDFARINLRGPGLPGVEPDVGETRSYPLGPTTAFVSGYVGAVTDRDLENAPDAETKLLFRQPGFRIGRDGLERFYDEFLRGEPGSKTVKVNAHGRIVDELQDLGDPPVQGGSLTLTIDAQLQEAAMFELLKDETREARRDWFYEDFDAIADASPADRNAPRPGKLAEFDTDDFESAAAVVIDIDTGDILVMASTPGFDPNGFVTGIEAEKWRELNKNPYKPLLNKPISGAYPPGSTFKLVTAIAAQQAGVDPFRAVNCNGRLWYGNRYFHCWMWDRGGHGAMNLPDAIKHSCDVYFYELAKTLDIDLLANVARNFGLGRSYDLGLPGQTAGVVPDRDWKRSYFRSNPEQQAWFQGETLSVAIGQGYVTSSPLQLAVMTARLASGRAVEPRIVRAVGAEEAPDIAFSPLGVGRSALDIVRAGMEAVVNEPGGTAVRSALPDPDWRLAGKTGTSQVRRISDEERAAGVTKNEDLPWARRDHALFVCYAPAERPRYACSVVVEHGGSGSKAAGPKAREIMRAVTRKDPASRPPVRPGPDAREPVVASSDPGGERVR